MSVVWLAAWCSAAGLPVCTGHFACKYEDPSVHELNKDTLLSQSEAIDEYSLCMLGT